MGLNRSSKAALTGAGTGMLAGLLALLHGVYHDHVSRTVSGTCLTLVSLTAIALVLIRKWIIDTRDERRILAATQREAQARKDTYITAQAALEAEHGRLRQDIAAEREANAARLTAEREALATEFEAKRGEYMAEALDIAVQMIAGKKLAPTQIATARLIQFPRGLPHQQADQQRQRSRERGVVGP